MILRHCHTIADRDAWYECPVCGACSPTASVGTFDENSIEAYKLACRIKDSFDILDMNLIDIVEMFCDWKAATERQHDGNLLKSITANAARFGYDDQIKRIFLNTAKLFDEV